MCGKKDVGSVYRSVRYGEHWCRRARNADIVEPQSQWSVVRGTDGKMRAISVGVMFVYGHWLPIVLGGFLARDVFKARSFGVGGMRGWCVGLVGVAWAWGLCVFWNDGGGLAIRYSQRPLEGYVLIRWRMVHL